MFRLAVIVIAIVVAAAAPSALAQAPDGGVASVAPEVAPTTAVPAKLDAKKLVPPKPSPPLLEKGRLAFIASCVVCHGEKGVGDGLAGQMLNPRPRDFTKEPFKQGSKPAEIFVSITEGVKDTPMVGWSHLSDEERWGLTYYVLSLAPSKAKAKAK